MIWPLVCILACLFMLSVASPRVWQRANHERIAALDPQLPQMSVEGSLPAVAVVYRTEDVDRTDDLENGVQEHQPSAASNPAAGAPRTESATVLPPGSILSFPPESPPAPASILSAVAAEPLQLPPPAEPPLVEPQLVEPPLVEPQLVEPQLVDPAPQYARQAEASETDVTQTERQQAGEGPVADRWADAPEVAPVRPLAQAVVPHDEVFSSDAENLVADRRGPETLAYVPSPTQAEQGRLLPPDAHAKRSDGGTRPVEPGLSASDLPDAAGPDGVDDDTPRQGATGAASRSWSVPDVLLQQMKDLSAEPIAGRWAAQTTRLIEELGQAVVEGSDSAPGLIEQLRQAADQVEPLATQIGDFPAARDFRRVGYALRRRLDVWQQIVRLDGNKPIAEPPEPDPEQLALALAKIDAMTGGSDVGKAWREYLLIDALKEWSSRHASRQNIRSSEDRLSQTLAQQTLKRLSQTPTSIPQRRFLSSEPLLSLQAELRPWAVEPVHAAGLLAHMEQYERSGLTSDARVLAKDCRHLEISSRENRRELAHRLEVHYRNANFRIAVTETLLNRLMPERDPEYDMVRDTVLDTPVRGNSLTSTEVAVRMLPDPRRVRMALEVTGKVESLTRSTTGPVTFYNGSDSMYVASKPLEVDMRGIRLWPAEVKVDNNTRLRGMATDFDGVPLVGSLVQGMARERHEQKRQAAEEEIKRKVATKAKQRIDSESDARLTKVTERFRRQIVEPLEALSLGPAMVDAETTAERFTMRFRLAGEDQLGSHTPRPRAPSDCLASLQIHETAINNVLNRLELDGRTFSLPELTRHVAEKLNRPALWEDDPENEDVSISFAEQDPITVRLQDNRIELRLAIAELRKAERSWKDFEARTFYKPHVEGRSIELARDGVVELNCPKMGSMTRISLRGVFARIFLKNRPWTLSPEMLIDHPKLADVAFTQFVIDGGWIGAALGPASSVPPAAKERLTMRP